MTPALRSYLPQDKTLQDPKHRSSVASIQGAELRGVGCCQPSWCFNTPVSTACRSPRQPHRREGVGTGAQQGGGGSASAGPLVAQGLLSGAQTGTPAVQCHPSNPAIPSLSAPSPLQTRHHPQRPPLLPRPRPLSLTSVDFLYPASSWLENSYPRISA